MTDVAIIANGGANIASLRFALDRLGASSQLTTDVDELRRAPRVILPGVGAAADAMERLHALGLAHVIPTLTQPVLGICLGMQLLFEGSDEGDVACLGLLPGRVRKLVSSSGVRVPHMGWNTLEPMTASPLLDGVDADASAYFVHSYAAPVTDDCIASCTHGEPFAAMVRRGNVAGAQFHPERSAAVGARLLSNFLQWNGA